MPRSIASPSNFFGRSQMVSERSPK
jgi:hypothetical protein